MYFKVFGEQRQNIFREPKQLFSGIWAGQCIIFREQGSTDPPGGPLYSRAKNATKEICQVKHVVHKHELHERTMTRTLSKAPGLFECIDFVYKACWLIYMNILTTVTDFISF